MKSFLLYFFVAVLATTTFATETTTSSGSTDTTTVITTTTTDPAPAPAPNPVVIKGPAKFQLENGNITCVVGEFSGSIVYNGFEGASNFTLDYQTTLDKSKSSCSDKRVVLSFTVQDNTNVSLGLILTKANGTYHLDQISSIYNFKVNNKSEHVELSFDKTVFSVSEDHSYVCLAEQAFQLIDVSNKNSTADATLNFENFKLDAFRSTNTTELRTASECSLDNKPRDLIPLAVAIALVALIVIVLISYLIGRKRSRRLAYESV